MAAKGRDAKVAKAVREALLKGQPVLVKCMFLEYLTTAREFEKAILLEYMSHSNQLLNRNFLRPTIDVNGKEIVGQLDRPTMGCQVWLDISSPIARWDRLVLPHIIGGALSTKEQPMPEGIFKLKGLLLPKSKRTNKNLARLQKEQKKMILDLDIINGNGLIEEGG